MLRNMLGTRGNDKTNRIKPQLEVLEDRTVPATLVGLTTTNRLVMFDSAAPNVIQSSVKITGVGNQDVVSIDARPANGLIYALTSTNRLFIVNPYTGAATRVGTDPVGLGLNGGRVAIDFNANVDRLRVVTNSDQNFRYNPVTGAIVDADGDPANGIQADANLNTALGNPTIVAVAYDRNFQGTTQTTLYGIDSTLNSLVTIGGINGVPSPNAGDVFNVGALDVNPGNLIGFDIAADGTAFAAWRSGNPSRLYTIDLGTGHATQVGKIGNGTLTLEALTTLPREEIVYGVTVSNRLISFRASDPGRLLSARAIQGMLVGENVTGIDFRPASGELFARTSLLRVMRIEVATGQATQLGVPIATSPALSASAAGGFDFSPTVDRLRLVNTARDNLRYDPLTFTPVDSDGNGANGNTADTDVDFDLGDINSIHDPNIVGIAYDRNDNDGATATTLFGIDSNLGIVVTIGGVNGAPTAEAGGVFTVGSLTVLVTDLVGFDIIDQGTNGIGAALAVMQVQGDSTSTLFSINLQAGLTNQLRGTASSMGTVGGGELVRAMSIAPPTIQLSAAAVSIKENKANAVITITRTGGTGAVASVLFSALGATATGGGVDYVDAALINAVITFNRGETTKTVVIPLVNDTKVEGKETILLSLASVSGGVTVLGNPATAVLTILDDPQG